MYAALVLQLLWVCVIGQSILVLNTSVPSNPQGQTAIVDVSVQTAGSFDPSAQGTLTLAITGSNPRAYFWASNASTISTTLVQGRTTIILTSNYVENITVRVLYSNVSVVSGGVQNTSVCLLSFVADVPRVLWMDSLGASDYRFAKYMVVDSQRYVYLTLYSQTLQKRSPAHQVVWTRNVSSVLTGLALSPDESAVYAIADGFVFKFASTGTMLWNVSNGPFATPALLSFQQFSVPVNGILVTPTNQVICVGRRYFGSVLVIIWQLDPDSGAIVANLTQDGSGSVTLFRVGVDRNSGSVWAYGTFNTTCVVGNRTINFIYRPYEAFLIQFFPNPNATGHGQGLQVSTVFQVAWPEVRAYENNGYHFSSAGVSLEVDVYGDVIVATPIQLSASCPGCWTMKIFKYSQGAVSWVYNFVGGEGMFEQTALVSDSTGNLYLALTVRSSYSVNGIAIPFVSLVTDTSRARTSNVVKIARDGTPLYAKCFASTKESFVRMLAIEKSTNFVVAFGDVVGNMTLDASVAIDTGTDNVQFLTAISPSILEYPLAFPQQVTTAEDTPVLITLSGSYFQQPIVPSLGFRGRIDKLPVSGTLFTVSTNGSLGDPIVTTRTILAGLELWYVPPPYKHSGVCRSGLCNGTQIFDVFEYSMVAFGAVSLAAARVDMVVSAVPNAPTADPQAVDAAENVVLVISLTGSSVDGPPNGPNLNLSAIITRPPPANEGSLYQFDLSAGALLDFPIPSNSTNVKVSNMQNQILYLSPNNRGNFSTHFEFAMFDGLLNSTSAQVAVNVQPINQRPTAQDFAVSGGGRIVLQGTDMDSAESLLRFFIADLPKQGQLFQCTAGVKGPVIDTHRTLITDSTHCVFYEAITDFARDTFTFLVNDGQLDSLAATVTIGMCSPGYFQNTTNGNECQACEAGKFSSARDQLQCSPCLASYYQLQDGQQSCQPCPSHVDVCAGEVVVVSANYWALTSSDATKVVPVQCLPKMCVGNNECSENREAWNSNPLCGKCLPGYSEWGTNCINCSQSNGGSVLMVILICFAATLILRWSVSTLNARGADGLICAYFIQCALLIVGSSGNSALTFLNVFDFNFADSAVPTLSLSCPFYVGPLQKFGLSLGLVLLLFLNLGLIMLCHFVISRLTKRPFGNAQIDGYIRAACTLFLLAFNKITQTCIQYMSCKETGVSRVVVTQPGIECTTTAYANYLILVSIGLAICLLVGPGFILYLLAQKKTESSRYFELVKSTYDAEPCDQAKRFEGRWGSFFAPFDKHAFWYQLVILGRRTILIVFDSLLVNDPQARSVMILLATFSFFLFHLYTKPYRLLATTNRAAATVTANRLEAASLFLHLVLAMLVGPYQVPYPEGIVWTATVLICTVLILFIVYEVWKHASVIRSKLFKQSPSAIAL